MKNPYPKTGETLGQYAIYEQARSDAIRTIEYAINPYKFDSQENRIFEGARRRFMGEIKSQY